MEKNHEIGDGLASLWVGSNWRLLEAKICCEPWVLARSPTKMSKPACESVDYDDRTVGVLEWRWEESNVFFKHLTWKVLSHQIHLHPCLCLRNSAARCVVRACGRARSKCTEWAPLYMKCVIRRASGKNRGGFHSSWLRGGSFFFCLKNGIMQQVCWCVPYTNRNVTGTTPKIHFVILTLAFASRPQTCVHVKVHVQINYIPNTPNQYCPTTKFPQDNGGWSTRNFRFYKAFGSFNSTTFVGSSFEAHFKWQQTDVWTFLAGNMFWHPEQKAMHVWRFQWHPNDTFDWGFLSPNDLLSCFNAKVSEGERVSCNDFLSMLPRTLETSVPIRRSISFG